MVTGIVNNTVFPLSPYLRSSIGSIVVIHQIQADSTLRGPAIIVGYTTIEFIRDDIHYRNSSPSANGIVSSPSAVLNLSTIRSFDRS